MVSFPIYTVLERAVEGQTLNYPVPTIALYCIEKEPSSWVRSPDIACCLQNSQIHDNYHHLLQYPIFVYSLVTIVFHYDKFPNITSPSVKPAPKPKSLFLIYHTFFYRNYPASSGKTPPSARGHSIECHEYQHECIRSFQGATILQGKESPLHW